MYNICYVNAFQAQPDESKAWPADLLLRDAHGTVVVDHDWNEALLDLRTPARRKRVAARVNRWIDECADKGFDAVEPDNYDSYTRSGHLLTANDATALVTHAPLGPRTRPGAGHRAEEHLGTGRAQVEDQARLRGGRGVRPVRRVRHVRKVVRQVSG